MQTRTLFVDNASSAEKRAAIATKNVLTMHNDFYIQDKENQNYRNEHVY